MRFLSRLVFLGLGILLLEPFPAVAQDRHITVTATPGEGQDVYVVPANPYPSEVLQTPQGPVPVYRITVVGRTIRSVNYRYRKGDTRIDFRGTPLLAGADGKATVRSNQGFTKIDVDFRRLPPASQFGPEYLTYVLWAITPNGRPKSLGEIVPNSSGSTDLHVTTDMQAFGMMVTAEPYFSVTQPSDLVVMENTIRDNTQGIVEQVDANYELLKRGAYTLNVPPSGLRPIYVRGDLLQVSEARNAERIARWFGADRNAADTFARAQALLNQAEGYVPHNKKSAAMIARQATQNFEDARLIAVARQEEARLAAERAAQAAAQARARQQAQQEAQLRAEAERRQRVEAERAAAADQARQRAESQRWQALAAQQQALAAQQQALAAQQQAQSEAESARQEAARAEQLRQQAEQQRAQAREELREQLNQILVTRETARGLIMTMSDVLFDTGKWTLKPGAREKLAKVAGIMVVHPDLGLEIEGFTDSIGSAEFNQELSEKRANAVRDYLTAQGVRPDNIAARGFGAEMPVASNATAAGRQMNRRVEIVVSGESLGEPGVSSRR